MEPKRKLEDMPITHALEYYKNHCEFLGYSIEEEGEFCIVCHHPRKDLLKLILLKQNVGVMAQIIYSLPAKFYNDLIPLYMYVNELNSIFIFVKAYIRVFEDNSPIIVLTSVLEGEYSRHSFAIFLDNIDYDMRKFHSYPKTLDIWSE
ncbi:MAG: DNA mismatch repair protein [Nostoc sp.]|uniref:DNA mismatch repair protein n=1 Tax=Nostoc sp. TaxID=1180 RepID=UPI002FF943AE